MNIAHLQYVGLASTKRPKFAHIQRSMTHRSYNTTSKKKIQFCFFFCQNWFGIFRCVSTIPCVTRALEHMLLKYCQRQQRITSRKKRQSIIFSDSAIVLVILTNTLAVTHVGTAHTVNFYRISLIFETRCKVPAVCIIQFKLHTHTPRSVVNVTIFSIHFEYCIDNDAIVN